MTSFSKTTPWALPVALGVLLAVGCTKTSSESSATAQPQTSAAAASAPSYEGSSTIGNTILKELVAGFEASGHKFGSIAVTGSGEGFKAVEAGKASIGGMSRPLNEDEKKLFPYARIIGYDALSVIVNDKNPVKALTKAQLRDLFTGKVKSWKELGGPDAPVELVTEHDDGKHGTIALFKELVLGAEQFGATRALETPDLCVRDVADHPGAVTHASLSAVVPGTHALSVDGVVPSAASVRRGDYPLTRPLLLVSKGPPEGESRAFFEFVMSAQGQAVVAKKFVAAAE